MAKPNKKAAKQQQKQTSKAKQASKAVANERLVEAIQEHTAAMGEAKTTFVAVLEVIENEQLGRAEVVASYMAAKPGIEKSTADSQASRMLKILKDPEVFEQLRTGEIDLATARKATVKKQAKPNAGKQAENAQKRFASALSKLVTAAKDSGEDLDAVMKAVKAALKKAGVV